MSTLEKHKKPYLIYLNEKLKTVITWRASCYAMQYQEVPVQVWDPMYWRK